MNRDSTQRIGAVGEGWRVALTTLANERTAITAVQDGVEGNELPGGAANDAVTIWRSLPESLRTTARRDQLMQLWVRGEVGRLTGLRSNETARAGTPGPEGSVAKLEFAEYNKELYSFCVNLLGMNGQVGFDYTFRRPDTLDAMSTAEKGVPYIFLRVRAANSIEGGTSEILRNVIGEQVLGLPGEPRVDKDRPWAEVLRN